MRSKSKSFGYGIIQSDGSAWWDESCVCQDREPLEDMVEGINDDQTGDDHLRVVKLYYREAKPKRRKP